MKKQLAGILALAMSLSMASCSSGSDSGEAGNAASNETTTTAAAVKDETTAKADDGDTEASQDEEQETTVTEADDNYFEKALALLPDAELKRKYQEVKVSGPINNFVYELPELAIRLFEEKYGGTVTYFNYNSNADLIISSSYYFPKYAENGTISPIDDLIDLDSGIWSFAKDNKDYMEFFNFGGKHFGIVTDVSADFACYYNKKTIEEHGLDDPWELYKAGNWNWDTMKSMLSEFADVEDLYYGLDGSGVYDHDWHYGYRTYPRAFGVSTGVPMVGLSDGYFVSNFSDQAILSTLDFGRELFSNGLLALEYDNPKLLGDGDLLFYIGYMSYKVPDGMGVSSDDIGIVPVPSPAGSAPYQSATADGFALLSGSENPQGRDLFAQCLALAYSDPGYIAEKEQKQKELYEENGLSDQTISQLNEIKELARQYPVIDYAYSDHKNASNVGWTKLIEPAFAGDSVDSSIYDNFNACLEADNNAIKTYVESLG